MREGSVGGLRRCHVRSQGPSCGFWAVGPYCSMWAACHLRAEAFGGFWRVLCGCGACDALWG
eukprot:4686415-Prymnesium_polylepis.1